MYLNKILFRVFASLTIFVVLGVVIGFAIFHKTSEFVLEPPAWRWECQAGKCKKLKIVEGDKNPISRDVCHAFCDKNSLLWPKPNGKLEIGDILMHINVNSIDILTDNSDSNASKLIKDAGKRFLQHVHILQPKGTSFKPGGHSVMAYVKIKDSSDTELTLETDESYTLKVGQSNDGRLNATINAPNFFGARHGLETFGQLFIYDDIRNEIQVIRDVNITDKPAYNYRGILLDTARNYISVEGIKRTIDAMAMTKLNSFHWHITDSQSFPIKLPSQLEFSKLGAFSSRKVYTPDNVKDIVNYAKVRGVRVIPEFDAPAHVGEGWQNTDFVECFNAQPWQSFCVEPPCGQLNPTKPKLYDALEDIYRDIVDLFQPNIFHMGGDEVSLSCWNSTESITDWMVKEKDWSRTTDDFMKLWNVFQTQALERFEKYKKVPIIMWTSTLTNAKYIEQYLPKDKYIIQVWTTGSDKVIDDLLSKKYRIILSNYDALYFDCGFEAWVGSGTNWCAPYKGWKTVYNNDPRKISQGRVDLVLGAEAALWTEQADDSSLDNRLWPRAAALGERLWSDPQTSWQEAEQRMLIQRERFVERGIYADTLQPQWCLENSGYCYN